MTMDASKEIIARLVRLSIVFVVASCQNMNVSNERRSIDEDIQRGESLYSINLDIVKNNKEQEVASSIFAQEILTWKTNYIEKNGMKSWLKARDSFVKKYGYNEKMKWFLGSYETDHHS
jgi:hypothetical protein